MSSFAPEISSYYSDPSECPILTLSPDNPRDLNAQFHNVIRTMVAAKFEGDMCAELKKMFGKLFRRGEELSSLDAGLLLGILLRAGSCGELELILGVDVKTAVMSESWFKQGENQSDLAWRAQIASQPSQRQCDVFLVGWPLLRCSEYWTIMVDDIEKSPRLRFYTSGLSTWIEPVVPPVLWPLTVSKSQTARILESRRRQKAAKWTKLTPREPDCSSDDPLDLPTGWSTTDDLLYHNLDSSNYRPFVKFLRDALSATNNPVIDVSSTRYQPYTSDLCFEIGQDEKFFVEVKFGYATLCEGRGTSDDMVTIKHDSGLSLYGRPVVKVFSPTSGRWPMLLTEVSPVSERFKFQGGMIPGKMALVPRSLGLVAAIQSLSKEGSLEEVVFEIPARNIIDFRQDVATQLSFLLCDVYRTDLRLPPLESLESLSQIHVALPVSETNNDPWDVIEHVDSEFAGADLARDVSAADLRQRHAVQRQYQAKTSLLVLQECCKLRVGLIFDYQRLLGLRLYAFSGHNWSDADFCFTKLRPRCSPVEMFQLPAHQRLVFLSFTTVRCRSHDRKYFIHPSILQQLRQEARANTKSHCRRILLLAASENISAGVRTTPVYAIPVTAIHHGDINVDFQNHSRWKNIQLRQNFDMDDFRFGSHADFIKHLASVIEVADRLMQTTISLHGVQVECADRDDVFEEILPGFKKYIN